MKQRQIARLLKTPPYKVLVKASHTIGKSHLAGGIVNWWYDSHDPGIALTTAPTARQVRDILWKEIRVQRRGRAGFPGPKIPRLESGPEHYAHGFTAGSAEAFQGQHGLAVLLVFDEAVGVDSPLWDAGASMCQGVEYGWLCICNPTDTASRFYQEEQTGNWHVVHISCLEHPNIAAELAGEDPPYPSAVRLAWLAERLMEWCQPVIGEPKATDIEFPPGSGIWLRPGPLAEARLLGRWPSSTSGVWSDALWAQAENTIMPDNPVGLPEIGCDVARFGDDETAIHVRWHGTSLHHECANGWSTTEIAGRLKQLCKRFAEYASKKRNPGAAPVPPQLIPVKIDDDGVGGGVVDQAGDYMFVPISASSVAQKDEDYPNKRSELWFQVSEMAKIGRLSLARLPEKTRLRLKIQAMSPVWKLDAAGRRVVEPKDVTKKNLGRSPDDIDAMNLAYCPAGVEHAHFVKKQEKRKTTLGRN